MNRIVHCQLLDKELEGLAFQTWPGELGKRIYENISQQAWQQWMKHQTLLINEKRLNLMDPSTQTFLQGEFDKFIAGEEYEKAEGYVPPKP